jgi:DNA repair protein RadC
MTRLPRLPRLSIPQAHSYGGRSLASRTSLQVAAIELLKCVHVAALRLSRSSIKSLPLVNNWQRLSDYLRVAMARERSESVRILFLDAQNRLILDEVAGSGDVGRVAVYPRQIVRRALEVNATALILAHNHPSGDPTPSIDDIEMTQEIRRAAHMLGITLHDHVVVGASHCTSMRQLGVL